MDDHPRLLSTAEVAHMLAVSTRTVRVWAECWELPAFKAGRQWRFQAEAITSWLRKHHTGAPTTSFSASAASAAYSFLGKGL